MSPEKIRELALFMREQFNDSRAGAMRYLLARARCLELAGFPERAADYRAAAEVLRHMGVVAADSGRIESRHRAFFRRLGR